MSVYQPILEIVSDYKPISHLESDYQPISYLVSDYQPILLLLCETISLMFIMKTITTKNGKKTANMGEIAVNAKH